MTNGSDVKNIERVEVEEFREAFFIPLPFSIMACAVTSVCGATMIYWTLIAAYKFGNTKKISNINTIKYNINIQKLFLIMISIENAILLGLSKYKEQKLTKNITELNTIKKTYSP